MGSHELYHLRNLLKLESRHMGLDVMLRTKLNCFTQIIACYHPSA